MRREQNRDALWRHTPAPSEFDPTDLDTEDEAPACLPALFPTPPDDDDAPKPPRALPTKFASDWNLARPGKRRRVTASGQPTDLVAKNFPIKVDHRGRPQGLMQLGSLQREKFE